MELIDKAEVVAEIGRYISNYKDILAKIDRNYSTWVDSVSMIDAKIDVLQHLLSFLDTLEVKEVDYERELSKYVSNGIHRFFPNVDDDYCKMDSVIWQDYVIDTAKHFFELGLKAQKGE